MYMVLEGKCVCVLGVECCGNKKRKPEVWTVQGDAYYAPSRVENACLLVKFN